MLSEWASFVVREADTAFAMGADLASILTAVAAIETHLRAEYGSNSDRLVTLIDRASSGPGASRWGLAISRSPELGRMKFYGSVFSTSFLGLPTHPTMKE